MVKNKRELAEVANEFLAKAGEDLKRKVEKFMNEFDVTGDELADILGVDEDEIDKILEGDIDVLHIDTFAKLLIATNNAIQITPVQETPIREYGPKPIIPPFMPFPPFPPKGAEKKVDEPRRNVCRKIEVTDGDDAVDFYLGLPKERLVDIIKRNLWDSEIMCATASKETLANFLANKEKKLAAIKACKNQPCTKEEKPRQKVERNRPFEGVKASKPSGDVFGELLKRFDKFVSDNPDIFRKIK